MNDNSAQGCKYLPSRPGLCTSRRTQRKGYHGYTDRLQKLRPIFGICAQMGLAVGRDYANQLMGPAHVRRTQEDPPRTLKRRCFQLLAVSHPSEETYHERIGRMPVRRRNLGGGRDANCGPPLPLLYARLLPTLLQFSQRPRECPAYAPNYPHLCRKDHWRFVDLRPIGTPS